MKLIRQFWPFFKYCVVGTLGTAVDVGALYLLVEYARLPLLLATTIAFILAVTHNFLLNKIWTFQNKSQNFRKLYIKFLIISIIGLALTNLFMYLFVILAGIWYIFAKLLTSLIVLTWNFLGNKYWTFKISQRQVEIPETFDFDLSIVIPAYNEENRIKSTLLTIADFVDEQSLKAEIIVVDDGSGDRTAAIVRQKSSKIPNLRLVRQPRNLGKGAAVRAGVETATGATILMTDADNSTPIEEYLRLAKHIDDHHIVIGSRHLRDSDVKVRQPLTRRVIGRVGNTLINIFLISGIKDTQCGFKLFRHAPAKEIFSRQKITRWGFDMEALAIAELLDYPVKEVPVSWFNSLDTRLRPVRDTLRTAWELIYIKLNLMSGRYHD